MRKLLASVLLILGPAVPSFAQKTPRVEVAVGYTGVRTNEPPGNCGCFVANGASASVAYNFNQWIGIVGNFGGVHTGNASSTGLDLTLLSYLFGPRVSYRKNEKVTPFGQFLLGGAHGSGTLNSGRSGGSSSANAFAMTLGGGLDVKVNRRFAVRAFQLEYFRTEFPNAVNGRQNIFRFGAGVLMRLGHTTSTKE